MSDALRDYQITDLSVLINNPKKALLYDAGGGKTPTAAAFSQYLRRALGHKSIWAQPKSLMHKNRAEIERFTNLKALVIEGTPKKRAELMQQEADVYLCTFNFLSTDVDKLLEVQPEIKGLFIDESQRGYSTHGKHNGQKIIGSARTFRLYSLVKKMYAFIPMTGTLIAGRLDSAFPVIHAINPMAYGTYENFMKIHAVTDEWGSVIYWKNHHILGDAILKYGIRRSFESIYGKEAKVITVCDVEMTKSHRKPYQEFHDKSVLELEEIIISGEQPSQKLMRARKILNAPHAYGLLPPEELTAKEEYALAEFNPPMAFFGTSPDEVEHFGNVLKKEGYRVGVIHGGVSGDDRVQIDQDFRAGKLDAVVVTVITGGTGFNWAFLDRIMFLSMDWSDDAFLQAYRRGIRGIRDKPLLIYILNYLKTIDQHIMNMVFEKSKAAKEVTGDREVYDLQGTNKEPKFNDWK